MKDKRSWAPPAILRPLGRASVDTCGCARRAGGEARYTLGVTVAEQILEEVRELDERRQLAVLAIVKRLRAEPDVSLAEVDFDDERNVDAWRARLQARAGLHVADAMAQFRTLGLVEESGRVVERELPADMRPGSKTSVAT